MISELCIDVLNSFEHLKTRLNALSQQVCAADGNLPAWFKPPPQMALNSHSPCRLQAMQLICQLEYLDQQQPREILVGAGLVAASIETIEAIKELNLAKIKFKQAMLKLKAQKIAPSDLAVLLHNMGLARAHLKQCYRLIPYFLKRPKKISWTWANTRSIKKIKVKDAEILLKKHNQDAGIERQLKLLQGLDANEPLAIIQELAPHLRVNVLMPDDKRLMVKGPVPIFYLDSDNLDLPEFTPPGEKKGKDKERVIRKDVKINPEPFLPAIRAHRYYQTVDI